jgi:drug/metabolite transporter superfamily protein YnfA
MIWRGKAGHCVYGRSCCLFLVAWRRLKAGGWGYHIHPYFLHLLPLSLELPSALFFVCLVGWLVGLVWFFETGSCYAAQGGLYLAFFCLHHLSAGITSVQLCARHFASFCSPPHLQNVSPHLLPYLVTSRSS